MFDNKPDFRFMQLGNPSDVADGEVLTELEVDPTREYQPQKNRKIQNPGGFKSFLRLARSHSRADRI